MKKELTLEQSAKLIERGIAKEKASASKSEVIYTEQKYGDTTDVRIITTFTLTDCSTSCHPILWIAILR